MPKGQISRPDNRKVKQAINRRRQRLDMVRKGGQTPEAKKRVLNSQGAKKDSDIIVSSRTKAFKRDQMNEVGKRHLLQPSSDTQRERLKRKK